MLAYALGVPGLILFAAGIPLFNWWWLRKHRLKHELEKNTGNSKGDALYSFLYEEYEDE